MKKAGTIDTQAGKIVAFDDAGYRKEGMAPVKVRVFYGAAVDSVQLVYDGEDTKRHGGSGGGLSEGVLKDGAFIKKVRATTGSFGGVKVLTALAFYDQDGRLLAGNERKGDTQELQAEDGEYICALYGKTVKAGGLVLVSAIGIYTDRLPHIKDVFGTLGNLPEMFKTQS